MVTATKLELMNRLHLIVDSNIRILCITPSHGTDMVNAEPLKAILEQRKHLAQRLLGGKLDEPQFNHICDMVDRCNEDIKKVLGIS